MIPPFFCIGNRHARPLKSHLMDGVSPEQLVILLVLLQIKHFICDGPLQTRDMVRAKGHYGRWLGIVHALVHGAGTLVVLMVFGVPLAAVAMLSALDVLIHYHVDFSKEALVRRKGWTTAEAKFWWALAADQGLHQLTYLLLAFLVVRGV
jgi:hypothetical protein